MTANFDEALKLLRTAIDDSDCDFRDGQWEAIDAVLNQRKRALVVQSTSWGKSMIYFIVTSLLRNNGGGPTIVVSPLLALMRNQVDAAAKIGLRAATLNSSNEEDHAEIKAKILANEIDLILLSPEKLANDSFVANYMAPIIDQIGMLVIDEAHCISDWGHDFRPDYRRIVRILHRLPDGIPVLATTATANDRVVADVKDQLGGNVDIFRGPLIRQSLTLDCVKIDDPAARLSWLTKKLKDIEGSGIIYVLTQRDTERVVHWLQSQGIGANAYHGGIPNEERLALEEKLLKNDVKCLVATSALGMGFDKPDLCFVIHFQAPSSVVDYYQQVGRAGRGIDSAYGCLIFGSEDREINEHFRNTAFPPKYRIDQVLASLENSEDGLSLSQLIHDLNIRQNHITGVLKFLEVADPAPVIYSERKWRRTPNPYKLDEDQIAHLTRQRKKEWDDIVRYGEKNECLMVYLAKNLDDPNPTNCGKCSVCTGKHSMATDYDHAVYTSAQQYLNRSEMDLKPRKQFADPELGRKFGMRNSTIPAGYQAQVGRILSRYGEPIIGQLVKECKPQGHFSDPIVNATVELIRDRWPETGEVTWITCIPSKRHLDLVPQFAKNVASCLGLPFVDALRKVEDNGPQKNMENSYHQCENLLGAFSVVVPDEFQGKSVLLIDDISDSGWTMTIASFLLLSNGSGSIYPFALATSKPNS